MAEKPYARIGETLSILEVMSLGKAIVLSDYSSWRVRWIHKWKAAFWSINQKVVVIENVDEKYPYKLKNADVSFGKEIDAGKITGGKPPEIPNEVA